MFTTGTQTVSKNYFSFPEGIRLCCLEFMGYKFLKQHDSINCFRIWAHHHWFNYILGIMKSDGFLEFSLKKILFV